MAGFWYPYSAKAVFLQGRICWSLAPSVVGPGCAEGFDGQQLSARVFHICAVQEQLIVPGGEQGHDQAQGACMEISAKNSFFIFFFFQWPRYKSLKMAVDNGNADSTVAVVTVALLWLCEERIDCCQQMTTFFNFRSNSLDVLTLFTLVSVHSCLSAECQGQLKN